MWVPTTASISLYGVVTVVVVVGVIKCNWCSYCSTNSTNNNLEKFSYITNNESRIFIQEETNFITNLFT